MKKLFILGTVLLAGVALTGCDDFLEDNRYPGHLQIDNPQYWSNPENVQAQITGFYEDFLGYGNGSGYGAFYFTWTTDDQCGRTAFADWKNLNVPTSSSNWSGPYTEIRHANQIIQGVEASNLSESQKNNFLGLARFYRARQYFDLVKKYGDVPLVTTVLDVDSPELYGARTNRNEVMDFVLEDLDFAIANIATQSGKTVMSVDLARAMKAEICLYEASYARYHQTDDARARKFYQEVLNAAEPIAANYPICDDYTSLYKAFRTDGHGYKGLSSNSEVIFMKAYEDGVLGHSTMDYSCASDGIAGITRDAFDSFLLLNGQLPAEGQDKGELAADGSSISIANLLADRDQRLAMTTYDHLIYQGMAWAGPNTAPMWSMTGYGVAKYDNWEVSNADATTANRSFTCAPLFWGARLYLAILEAKAELGTLNDADLTKYMKPLWDRAGFTVAPTVALLSSINDPANDVNVSSLVWEIRRCRRCELMMDDDIRYWDLVRWHMLDHMDTTKYPKIIQGANVSMDPNNTNPTIGEYLDCSFGQTRTFHERQYLYPVPAVERQLNPALTQNPGWD